MVYSEPALWEAAKRAARERLGGHSARAMQLAGQLYRAAGGRYLGRKSKAQQSLTTWTRQDWTTKSGKPSRETGERYLPRRVIEQLSSADYAATTRAKRQGTKQGKQFVKQPAAIAAKVARLKAQANPRPRKYASAAEKQAAFRARFPTICVRVEPKTADTVQAIADASGRTQQETLLSMLKYAMTNRNWLTLGLTEHKQLPRIEEPRKENPTMKRKPTPAQIAARERFAEMARSGAFKKKAAKARKNPAPLKMKIRGSETPDNPEGIIVTEAGALRFAKANMPADLKRSGFVPSVVAGARGWSINYGKAVPGHSSYSRNPAKKTVSQKISQLTREGYPQKQAVAIALNEERAGKVKRNPITETLIYGLAPGETRDYMEDLLYDGGLKLTQAQIDQVLKAASAAGYHSFRIAGFDPTVKPDFTKALKTGRKRNPRASNPIILVSDKAIATKRKRNPINALSIKYACIMPEPGGMAYGIDERTPVTIRFSASELKRAYKCYLIPANVRESAGYKRLIAKQKEVYMSLAELKQLFRSFV